MLYMKGSQQNMRRKVNYLDNDVIKNSFSLPNSELLNLKDFDSTERFKQKLVAYLEFCNKHRIKPELKCELSAFRRQQALSVA